MGENLCKFATFKRLRNFRFFVTARKRIRDDLALLRKSVLDKIKKIQRSIERIGARREKHRGAIYVRFRRKMFGDCFGIVVPSASQNSVRKSLGIMLRVFS